MSPNMKNDPPAAPERLATRAEVAARLHCTTRSVDRYRDAGLLGPTYRRGGSALLDMAEVEAYIVACREPTRIELAQRRRRR